MKTYRVTIQMKFIKQYFLVARFVLQCITELRHKKRLPRFHRVTLMVNRVEVWVNKKKPWKHEPTARVSAFLVLSLSEQRKLLVNVKA